MKELDRILGILLVLQSRREATARQLAERFGVSTRTIYRDLQTISLLGIPVYAERGRNGGIRLLEGYFLPPLMFSREEAIALLLGLLLLRGLRAAPFEAEADTAAHKVLAALPEHLRALLAQVERILGVERQPGDIFHPEPDEAPQAEDQRRESATLTRFLRALLDRATVHLAYRSPYSDGPSAAEVRALGLFWDRDRWYLVGVGQEPAQRPRIWRADRVSEMTLLGRADAPPVEADRRPAQREGERAARASSGATLSDFDVRELLGQAWLRSAMDVWRERAPVRLRITAEQAERLRQDWYYRFARYAPEEDGSVVMSFGEGDPEPVLALVRWLGPGARILSPAPWRDLLRAELEAMVADTSS